MATVQPKSNLQQISNLHEKFPFLLHILIVALAILVMRSVSEKKQISNMYYMFFLVALFGFMFVGMNKPGTAITAVFKGAIMTIVAVALIYGMLQATSSETSNAVYMTNKVLGLVGLMIPLVALGLVYNRFAGDIDGFADGSGYSSFFVKFLFYIPCLITDFVAYLKLQFSLTPSVSYLLLGLEILLLLAFVFLPRLVSSKIKRDGDVLLKDAFLDEPRVIASSADLFSRDATPLEPRTCSFSMWIYTNQQPKKQDCNIFRYGSVSDTARTPKYNLNSRLRDNMTMAEIQSEILASTQSYLLDGKTLPELKQIHDNLLYDDVADAGVLEDDAEPRKRTKYIAFIKQRDVNARSFAQEKREKLLQELSDIYDAQTEVKPQIKYISSSSGKDNFRVIYGGSGRSHDISLPSQKWNNFVVSYDGAQVDLFVNGNLERSAKLDAPIKYSQLDQVVVGDERGIDGAICNVCFFAKPLTRFEIANSYNLLNGVNPPINM
jgi:hypothetical protein